MMKSPYDGSGLPRVQPSELLALFSESERSGGELLIGAEAEKIGVHERTGEPLGYGQAFGVCKVIQYLGEHHGWSPIRETADGPVLGLSRGAASITLEPGAQFELSGAPLPDVHAIAREQHNHFSEIAGISQKLGIAWLATGFHPLAKLGELPWVPKQRYPVMRRYLPTKGSGAHDMMLRTATVQANYDRTSEADGMAKLSLALRISPLVHALSANSPFSEGAPSGRLSERGHVWLHMDPSRSGLIQPIWEKSIDALRYEDYVEWALDAGMFLFWRGSEIIENAGQTFRDFLEHGYQGHHATLVDFKLHLTTLFPEVRLKNTLEVRSADSQDPALQLALIALWTGVLYDDTARDQALEMASSFQFDEIQAARPELVARGLRAGAEPFGGQSNFQAARRLVEFARGGLARRARVEPGLGDETVYLRPLEELLERAQHPADGALERFQLAEGSPTERILRATRFELVP
jgi:glutamate--cysteine ligase